VNSEDTWSTFFAQQATFFTEECLNQAFLSIGILAKKLRYGVGTREDLPQKGNLNYTNVKAITGKL